MVAECSKVEDIEAAKYLKVWAKKQRVSYILLIREVTEPTQIQE